jgi:hypothetical protein
MPILIGVSPYAKVRIGGENSVEAPDAAPAFMRPRQLIAMTGRFIKSSDFEFF